MDTLLLSVLSLQLQLAQISLERLQPVASAAVLTTDDYKDYAVREADTYGINTKQFLGTIQCESAWDPTKQSEFYKNGKREESYGIAQINLPAHLDVTYDQATDGMWSINWAARQFSIGNAKIWTCWRNMYGYDST